MSIVATEGVAQKAVETGSCRVAMEMWSDDGAVLVTLVAGMSVAVPVPQFDPVPC